MSDIKLINGVMKITPQNARLTGVLAGVNPLDAINKAQFDSLQQGTVDVTRIELASDGTAAAPNITWNTDTDTGFYLIGANNIGITASGSKVVDISTTGVAVTGAISATTTVTATTSLSVGTDQSFVKEVNHNISVAATTTAATAGGNIAVTGGLGNTSGAGGNASIIGGAGGATGAGGTANVTSGAGGGTSGASGAVTVSSGSATVGSSGTVTIASGNTASGVAGDIQLTPGTHTSTTVSPVISLNKAVIHKPTTKSAATGATLTGVELVGGYISVTGGTGNLTLPSTANITTAIGSTPAGTYFDFVVNATNMTATNVVTLVLGANMVVMKQTSAGDSATDQLLTVTQTSGTQVGVFRLTFDTATTTTLHRIG